MNQAYEKPTKADAFVNNLFNCCQQDKGLAARLRRADNPATEYQSWDMLVHFNINLNQATERLPYALIAAAVAKSRADENGSLKLGQALMHAFAKPVQKYAQKPQSNTGFCQLALGAAVL